MSVDSDWALLNDCCKTGAEGFADGKVEIDEGKGDAGDIEVNTGSDCLWFAMYTSLFAIKLSWSFLFLSRILMSETKHYHNNASSGSLDRYCI